MLDPKKAFSENWSFIFARCGVVVAPMPYIQTQFLQYNPSFFLFFIDFPPTLAPRRPAEFATTIRRC
jgi:hypothetical protein